MYQFVYISSIKPPKLKCNMKFLCGITDMKTLAHTFCNYLSSQNKIWYLVEDMQRENKNIQNSLKKYTIKGAKDRWEVKNTYCPFRGPLFGFSACMWWLTPICCKSSFTGSNALFQPQWTLYLYAHIVYI